MVRTVDNASFNSWEDVDHAFKAIAEYKIAIFEHEATMNEKIIDAKKTAEEETSAFRARIETLEKQIKEYSTLNKNSLDGQSKTLNFGGVSFRKSTRISIPIKKYAEIIERLKKNKMENCINVEEKINKETLERYNDEVLNIIGVKRVHDEKFSMEVYLDKVK
jgi:phage host-nuclease inhibitor protein Gam